MRHFQAVLVRLVLQITAERGADRINRVGIQSSEVISMRGGRIRIQRDPESSLRVSDDILKCVGYVYQQTHKDATGVYGDVWATGFFVSLPCASPELKEHHRMHYFVTAKHVITDLQHSDIFLTANKKNWGNNFRLLGARAAFLDTPNRQKCRCGGNTDWN
jgi:hypothetical protein